MKNIEDIVNEGILDGSSNNQSSNNDSLQKTVDNILVNSLKNYPVLANNKNVVGNLRTAIFNFLGVQQSSNTNESRLYEDLSQQMQTYQKAIGQNQNKITALVNMLYAISNFAQSLGEKNIANINQFISDFFNQ